MKKIIYGVGLYQVGTQVSRFVQSNINLAAEKKEERLQETFGKGEWAVITGASEGIGREYALQLAKAGFNLILVSRTTANLERVASEAQFINPSVQTRVVSLDLSQATPEQVRPIFEDQRISIVINNAGKMDRAKFLDQNPQDIEDMMKTNMHHDVIFSKYATLNFLKHAGEHNHKTALIHTSSIASDLPMPFSGVYSGTKRFNEVFGLLLAHQFKKSTYAKDLISTQILKPSITTTRLAHFKEGAAASKPADVVAGSLADLGLQQVVYGSMSHNLQGLTTPFFLNSIVKHFVNAHSGELVEDPFKRF